MPSLRGIWTTRTLPETTALLAAVRAMEDRVRPTDDMVVLFTSGSTGPPKGVIHTHGGALRATAASLEARCIRPGERLYVPMPFFWTGGLATGLLSAALAGATLLTEAAPEPARTLRFLEHERVTLFRGWPDQAAQLAADPTFADVDLSSLGDASLGALLAPDRRPAPGARPNIFGMTETFGPYCGDRLDVDLPAERFGSCGRPFDGVEVRIADPETGEECAVGDEGEIWLRGPNLFRGICGRPRSSVFTPDGFFRTGDRGRVDEAGYLWYRGRLDDMFKVSGASVYPSEVEAALRSVDGVRQAHVTDVEGAGGRAEVGALVITDETAESVRAAVRDRLSAFKVPTRWVVTRESAQVPTSATGKIDKRALARPAQRGERGLMASVEMWELVRASGFATPSPATAGRVTASAWRSSPRRSARMVSSRSGAATRSAAGRRSSRSSRATPVRPTTTLAVRPGWRRPRWPAHAGSSVTC